MYKHLTNICGSLEFSGGEGCFYREGAISTVAPGGGPGIL
jgi:hypothetical protein